MMNANLLNVLILVPIFLFSLCFHEFAHAWTAVKRGDSTPLDAGRLSMHPLAHADYLGTLILPTLCIYYGVPFIGWAKPVPIDARNFKYLRWDTALVASAGPISNLILAIIATLGLAILVRIPSESQLVRETLPQFVIPAIQVNLMLAFFNLLPLPPLDGFMVLQAIIPKRLAAKLYGASRFIGIILVLLLFSGGLRILSFPVRVVFRWLVNLAI